MKGKGEPRAGGAGGHSSLTFNHRQAAALGCEQNKSDGCGLLKSNIIWGDYHTERHRESSHSGRLMRSLAAPQSAGWCFLNRAGRASPRLTRTWHRCPVPAPGTRCPGSQGRVSIGDANEADHRLMLLGKTLRIFC